MAEIVRKTGVRKSGTSGDGVLGPRKLRCFVTEVTTGGAETSGTVTLTTDFGTLAQMGVLAFLASPAPVTIQQDTGTVVAATVTAAGVVTTGTITAAKDYYVVAFAI